jgi:uncharacterized protein YjiK
MKIEVKWFVFQCLSVAIITVIAGGCEKPATQADPYSIVFPYEWVGNIDQANLNEPSGIVFHFKRKTLFVVGDEGDICEIMKDGTLINSLVIEDCELEGITYDPSTGLLYAAIEGDEKIIEIDPEDFKILRQFAIERTFQGSTVLKSGGQGIEAITFAPDPNHSEGGTFFVANQSFDLDDEEDPSAVLEVEVPLRSGSGDKLSAKIIGFYPINVIDLAGLQYDGAADHLHVISDATNTFFETTRTGQILQSYAFPGDNQEGITLDDEGFVYIAQDSGGIIKIKWTR